MKILKAKYILTCNPFFEILSDQAIVFDKKILKIGDFKKLKNEFKDAKIYDFGDDILLPGFVNPHTHLEFSANSTNLIFGDFSLWLESVIKNRDLLSSQVTDLLMFEKIKEMVKSGVTTIGEISSFGKSLEVCAKSGVRFFYFNEILGTNDKFFDEICKNFEMKFEKSLKFKSELFIPTISIHSPYSITKNLVNFALNFAKNENLIVSTHLLESVYEKKWLNNGSGFFKKWLNNFTQNPKPHFTFDSFVENFSDFKTLFTHCVFVKNFSKFNKNLHSITHCAMSNRLLGKNVLNIENVLKTGLNLNIATDGLSSNLSLNFFDELRSNLFIHNNFDLSKLAKILLISSTKNGAEALNLQAGEIKVGNLADFCIYEGFECENLENLPLWLILKTKEAKKVFIGGKEWEF